MTTVGYTKDLTPKLPQTKGIFVLALTY